MADMAAELARFEAELAGVGDGGAFVAPPTSGGQGPIPGQLPPPPRPAFAYGGPPGSHSQGRPIPPPPSSGGHQQQHMAPPPPQQQRQQYSMPPPMMAPPTMEGPPGQSLIKPGRSRQGICTMLIISQSYPRNWIYWVRYGEHGVPPRQIRAGGKSDSIPGCQREVCEMCSIPERVSSSNHKISQHLTSTVAHKPALCATKSHVYPNKIH